MSMTKISAIIVAKDEENMIADCIRSVHFCDEVIVIDTGSKDKTVDIAKKEGASVVHKQMTDYAEIRNFGKEQAKTGWILYVDADERVTEELRKSISAVTADTSYAAFRLKRKNFYLGNHEWPYTEKLERLFRRSALQKWEGKLHESPKIDGRVGDIDGFLLHYTHRNLSEMVRKTLIWSKIEAELRYDAGHPPMTWWRFPSVMGRAFFNSYITQSGWKAGGVGIIESLYQAFSIFITYARLWELQNKSKQNNEK